MSQNIVLPLIVRCQRCGNNHENIVFMPLINAVDDFKWWAMCPNTNQPLLMAEYDDKNEGPQKYNNNVVKG